MWLANVAATLYGSGPVVSMLVTSRLWGGSWKKGYWALPAAGMKSLVRFEPVSRRILGTNRDVTDGDGFRPLRLEVRRRSAASHRVLRRIEYPYELLHRLLGGRGVRLEAIVPQCPDTYGWLLPADSRCTD